MEANKIQKYLELLREEHLHLQNRYYDLERRHDVICAAINLGPNAVLEEKDMAIPELNEGVSFVKKLVATVAELFDKDLYSDITIHIDGHQLRAHRFVLATRSNSWGVADLSIVDRLEFDDIPYNIGCTLLKWVYTDQLDPKLGDSYLLDLLRCANRFRLNALITRCEHLLIGRLNLDNCVRLYQFAEQFDLVGLKNGCSALLLARWDDFTAQHFDQMSAQLLYKMLKNRTSSPLHSAIRLRREDVVFLYLIEHDSKVLKITLFYLPLCYSSFSLSELLDVVDETGYFPLTLALSTGQEAIARALVSQRADVNAIDANGRSLLYRAIGEFDVISSRFLIENDADLTFACQETQWTLIHALASKIWPFGNSDGNDTMSSIAKMLIEKGAIDINAVDVNKRSALQLAIDCENHQMFDLLICCETINLNSIDEDGRSALSLALDKNQLRFAEQLAIRGADVNTRLHCNGNTSLHAAVVTDNLLNFRFLLFHKADVTLVNNCGWTAFHEAARKGSMEMITALIDYSADPNQTTNKGSTVLHIAVENAQEAVVEAIIASKKPLNWDIRDDNDETVFGTALWLQNKQMCTILINGGVSVDSKYVNGQSLLLKAICSGLDDSALFLLDHGAGAFLRTDDGRTCLHLAVECGLIDTVRALCKIGADLNAYYPQTSSVPLWTALNHGNLDVASILVEYGCDTNAWRGKKTLLHEAIDNKDQISACFLIHSFCDLNAVRYDGQTALHMATSRGLKDTVAALLDMHADVNVIFIPLWDVERKTALHLAIFEHEHEILGLLLNSADISLTIRDKDGQTPFSTAVNCGNESGARILMAKQPKVASQTNNKGLSWLHIAVEQNNLESVLFLLGVHVDVNTVTQNASKLTPLHLSAKVNDEMIMRNLILAGSDVNTVNSRGVTPLMLAASNDRPQLCSILLANGANCNLVDAHGENALHYAIYRSSLQCTRVLLTESRIDAAMLNEKGQTPLLLLGKNGKENAATIFDLFVETMDDYPVDRKDFQGNTLFLLAYMNGNANLCRTAVNFGVCLGISNNLGVSVFSHQTPTKQLLFRLLDQLESEPKWADGDNCSECHQKFSLTSRKHHCRHCGRLLCSHCSDRTMPVLKYELVRPVRVCDVCYDVLTLGTHH